MKCYKTGSCRFRDGENCRQMEIAVASYTPFYHCKYSEEPRTNEEPECPADEPDITEESESDGDDEDSDGIQQEDLLGSADDETQRDNWQWPQRGETEDAENCWIKIAWGLVMCSNCGYDYPGGVRRRKRCPHCGCEMIGVQR